MRETETKVLHVDPSAVEQKLSALGAELVLDTLFTVDWYGPADIYGKGKIEEGRDPWFLRVRSDSNGKVEITWKGIADMAAVSRNVTEINVEADSHQKACGFLAAAGLAHYAHQEKRRKSWKLKGWRFDLDTYPAMPPYLEIEGQSEKDIKEAIGMLSLGSHKTWSDGERTLIQKEYGLDWYRMSFEV